MVTTQQNLFECVQQEWFAAAKKQIRFARQNKPQSVHSKCHDSAPSKTWYPCLNWVLISLHDSQLHLDLYFSFRHCRTRSIQ